MQPSGARQEGGMRTAIEAPEALLHHQVKWLVTEYTYVWMGDAWGMLLKGSPISTWHQRLSWSLVSLTPSTGVISLIGCGWGGVGVGWWDVGGDGWGERVKRVKFVFEMLSSRKLQEWAIIGIGYRLYCEQ